MSSRHGGSVDQIDPQMADVCWALGVAVAAKEKLEAERAVLLAQNAQLAAAVGETAAARDLAQECHHFSVERCAAALAHLKDAHRAFTRIYTHPSIVKLPTIVSLELLRRVWAVTAEGQRAILSGTGGARDLESMVSPEAVERAEAAIYISPASMYGSSINISSLTKRCTGDGASPADAPDSPSKQRRGEIPSLW